MLTRQNNEGNIENTEYSEINTEDLTLEFRFPKLFYEFKSLISEDLENHKLKSIFTPGQSPESDSYFGQSSTHQELALAIFLYYKEYMIKKYDEKNRDLILRLRIIL